MTNTCPDSYPRMGFALNGRWLACSCSGNPFAVRGEKTTPAASGAEEFRARASSLYTSRYTKWLPQWIAAGDAVFWELAWKPGI
jgi:hypothetical protein